MRGFQGLHASGHRHTGQSAERLLIAYALLVPLLIIPRGGDRSIGASDVLVVFAVAVVARLKPVALQGARAVLTAFFVIAAIGTVGLCYANRAGLASLVLLARTAAIFVPLYLVARIPVMTRTVSSRILTAFLWSSAIACLVGIGMHYAGVQVRAAQQVNWYGDGYGVSLRAGGMLGNSSDFGRLSAGLVVVALVSRVVLKYRLRYVILGVVVGAYATYLSDSRAGEIHILIAVVTMLPVWLGRRRMALMLVSTPLILALGAVVATSVHLGYKEAFVLRRFDVFNFSGQSTFFSVGSRTYLLHRSLEFVQGHPLIGIGYGATGGGDNSFLTIAAETGVIAAVLYAIFWLGLTWKAGRITDKPVRYCALALLISEIAHMLTVDTQRMWSTTPVLIMIIAIMIRLGELPANKTTSVDVNAATCRLAAGRE